VKLALAERVMLGALLEAHPGGLSRAELARLIANRVAAEDAIATLVRDGVANTGGELVFASRAAVRTDQLQI
jgi:hypothetical protein